MDIFILRVALIAEITSVAADIDIFHALEKGEKRGNEQNTVEHAENKSKGQQHCGVEYRILHRGEYLDGDACDADPDIYLEAGGAFHEFFLEESEFSQSHADEQSADDIGQDIVYAEKRLKEKYATGKEKSQAERVFFCFFLFAFHKITCAFSIFSFWYFRAARFLFPRYNCARLFHISQKAFSACDFSYLPYPRRPRDICGHNN